MLLPRQRSQRLNKPTACTDYEKGPPGDVRAALFVCWEARRECGSQNPAQPLLLSVLANAGAHASHQCRAGLARSAWITAFAAMTVQGETAWNAPPSSSPHVGRWQREVLTVGDCVVSQSRFKPLTPSTAFGGPLPAHGDEFACISRQMHEIPLMAAHMRPGINADCFAGH